ncbi:MAG TPA: hypothetical protein VFN20_09650 [Candidatus Acidoferrum sp.]|nr:hypothetical protein [Candidatus Acidoferrum sp.]
MMSCEEFELLGLDMDRPDAQPAEAVAAAEHAASCARCFGLLEAWRELKQDLQLLHENTRLESAPARVEMRLKQELRTRRAARLPRTTIVVATWALAAAAVLVAAIGWLHWRDAASSGLANKAVSTSNNLESVPGNSMLLASDSDSGAFTRLPASMPSPYEAQEILQVRMQRGALGRFGLPVSQDRASEWVQVDFLIGEDGVPQAVRLHDESQMGATLQ